MNTETNDKRERCVSRCDEEFIECVGHRNHNCLESFDVCQSTCPRED